jgi:hypothetical protein
MQPSGDGYFRLCSSKTASAAQGLNVFFIESVKVDPKRSWSSTIDKDPGRGHDLCLRFFEKVQSFTSFHRRSGIKSVSGIQPICQCWCPPLLTPPKLLQTKWPYLQLPKSDTAVDGVIGTPMKRYIHRHPTHPDQWPSEAHDTILTLLHPLNGRSPFPFLQIDRSDRAAVVRYYGD